MHHSNPPPPPFPTIKCLFNDIICSVENGVWELERIEGKPKQGIEADIGEEYGRKERRRRRRKRGIGE